MDNNTRNNIIEKIRSAQFFLACIAAAFGFYYATYSCIDAIEKKMYLSAIVNGLFAFFVIGAITGLMFTKQLLIFFIKRYNRQHPSKEIQLED